MLPVRDNGGKATWWNRGDLAPDGNRYSTPTMLVRRLAADSIPYFAADGDRRLGAVLKRLEQLDIWHCLRADNNPLVDQDADVAVPRGIFDEARFLLVAAPDDGACPFDSDYNFFVYRMQDQQSQRRLFDRVNKEETPFIKDLTNSNLSPQGCWIKKQPKDDPDPKPNLLTINMNCRICGKLHQIALPVPKAQLSRQLIRYEKCHDIVRLFCTGASPSDNTEADPRGRVLFKVVDTSHLCLNSRCFCPINSCDVTYPRLRSHVILESHRDNQRRVLCGKKPGGCDHGSTTSSKVKCTWRWAGVTWDPKEWSFSPHRRHI